MVAISSCLVVEFMESPSGDLIDCVEINKQPSLDHPLLQTHKIQLKPTFNPSYIHNEESSNVIPQDWHINGKCPKGTIPIRRIQETHILRSSSLASFGKKYPPNFHDLNVPPSAGGEHEHSLAILRGGPFYGTRCDINAWNPRVEPGDFSLAQIWVTSDNYNRNTVEAGLMVNPQLYGDNATRLFTYWTDNHNDGNWWLTINGHTVGYWPNTLLKELQGGSKVIAWGGEVYNSHHGNGSSTTQMGSGHFAGEGDKKAAFFRNLVTLDDNGNAIEVTRPMTIVKNPKCYDFQFGGRMEFYYGGPGRNPNCP
ncbi:uncharacterized protein A4U43_C10F16430 [Asparagus officinalis]|uniref:Neprosin PEP catalytic domain-containing protein n=1 Tax=Asparagus officinalis TaxID=4686 RepID=A0A5P1E532_ASPOF|nr:uncharacterized protein A4U43_C10F16430 [Asparagus officinalis]